MKCIHCNVEMEKYKSSFIKGGTCFLCENKTCINRDMHGMHIKGDEIISISIYKYKDVTYYITSNNKESKTTFNSYGFWMKNNHIILLNKYIDLNSELGLNYIKKTLKNLMFA